jgi:hypothetical protein
MSLEFDLSRAAMREGMVDVYVSLGRLKRRGSASGSHAPSVDRAPLTGAALVNAFMQINPGRVQPASP